MPANRQNNPNFFGPLPTSFGVSQRTVAASRDDVGTNDPVKTLTTTQATPPADPNNNAGFYNDSEFSAQTAPQNAGVGAPTEDGTAPNNTVTQSVVNASANQQINPEPNVLDQYASYTYAISWYMLTPAQFNALGQSGQKNINTWSLLMQDGGAQLTPGNNAGSRNSYFNLDYYMDNLEIETQILGKGSGGPNNNTAMSFTVTEPNGFTLIDNLYRSAVDLFKQNSLPPLSSWQQVQYCLVIQFYGYDSAGNLVAPATGSITNNATFAGGAPAVVQKYFPFSIANLTTRIVNKQVEYKISCVPLPYSTGLGSARGSIPFNYEFSGTTLAEVLNGKPGSGIAATNQTQDGRVSTPTVQQAPTNVPNEQAVLDSSGRVTAASAADPNRYGGG